MATATNPRLKARLTAIRATRHKTGPAMLCDESYRQILQRAAGVSSSKEIRTLAQADAVLDEFRRLGLVQSAAPAPEKKPANEWAFVFRLPADRQPYAKKIYRLAEKLGAKQQPPVAVMPKAYIEGIASRMAGAETVLEFCDSERLHKIVQALEVHINRMGK